MTEHQASRAEHQGTEQAALRCNIYDCPRDSTHTVPLPVSTDTRLSPAWRRAATVSLCRPCFTDWQQHTDPNRLRENIDLVRARPPTPGGGMKAVERDVIAVPRDKDAKALVEAILEQANIAAAREELLQIVTKGGAEAGSYALSARLGTIHGDAERLKVLLAERDAEREERDKATEIALLVLDKAIGGLQGVQDMQTTPLVSIAALIDEAEAALARVNEAPHG